MAGGRCRVTSEALATRRRSAVARAVIGAVVVVEAVTQLVIARQLAAGTGGDGDPLRWAGTVAVASYVATVLLALLLMVINVRALGDRPPAGLPGLARFVTWVCGLRLPLLIVLVVGSGALVVPVGVGLLMISTLDALLCLVLALVTSSGLRRRRQLAGAAAEASSQAGDGLSR